MNTSEKAMNTSEWVSDNDGNRCSITCFGSRDSAEIALNTLRNCRNCTNCKRCTNCRNCTDCTDCTSCISCGLCSNCRNCIDCSNCAGCIDCKNCTAACIIGPTRSDGYTFFLSEDKHICAGCRNFATFAEARTHWNNTRKGTKLGIETEMILQALEQIAAL